MTLPAVAEYTAYVLWACVFLLLFSNRLLYAVFLVGLFFVAGYKSLEYAPALWWILDFILGIARIIYRYIRRSALRVRHA